MEYGKHADKEKIIKKSQYCFWSGHTSMAICQLSQTTYCFFIVYSSSVSTANSNSNQPSCSYANYCASLYQFKQIALVFDEVCSRNCFDECMKIYDLIKNELLNIGSSSTFLVMAVLPFCTFQNFLHFITPIDALLSKLAKLLK